MARYFLDTEFIEDGITIDLISIAIKCEDGRKLYLISTEFDPAKADEFVIKKVFPFLVNKKGERIDPEAWKSRKEIKEAVLKFIGNDDNSEFWAWYCTYDWVAFAQLFGKMVDLPDHLPMFCHELKQLAEEKGNPLKPEKWDNHHPMADAEWAEKYYNEIMKL